MGVLILVIIMAAAWLFRMSRIHILGHTDAARRRARLETVLYGGVPLVMVLSLVLPRSVRSSEVGIGLAIVFIAYLVGLLRWNRSLLRRPSSKEEA
jgi:hypothetical protein